MGARFRKAINLGPVRFTISKSGISYSVGTKGLRVTKTAAGRVRTTATIPGTGVSFVKEKSLSSNKKLSASNIKSSEPIREKRQEKGSSEPVSGERYEGPLPESLLCGEESLQEAARVVIGCGGASPVILQRKMGIGYSQSARLIDMLFERGIIGPYKIGEPREILFSPENNGGNI